MSLCPEHLSYRFRMTIKRPTEAMPIDDLFRTEGRDHVVPPLEQLSVRAYNLLRRDGVHTVGDLIHISEAHLRGMRNSTEESVTETLALIRNVKQAMYLPEPAYDNGLTTKRPDESVTQFHIRSIQAAAWQEGWESGWADMAKGHLCDNPYADREPANRFSQDKHASETVHFAWQGGWPHALGDVTAPTRTSQEWAEVTCGACQSARVGQP